jgi:hypothetical protein
MAGGPDDGAGAIDVRAAVARLVESHLEDILGRVMSAYDAAVPRFPAMRADERAMVREATRRTIRSFLSVYADDDRFSRSRLGEARRVTIARAGELFERAEILQMIAVARQVVFLSARELVEGAFGADPAREADVSAALDAFLDELERPERGVSDGGSALDRLLADAEAEGPDLA